MKKPRVYLIVASVVFGILGLLSVIPAWLSELMFVAPGSAANPATNLLFWSIATFPLICALAIVAAWVLYGRHLFRWALILIHLPLINVALGVAALVWSEVVYNGRFNG